MAKVDKVAQLLSELSQLGKTAPTPESVARLRELLRNKESLIVTPAAKLAGRWSAREAIPELLGAFERFVTAADSGCAAKTAIAETLVAFATPYAAEVFERGITIVQREPSWGGSTDVAANLRGLCALGLAALGHHNQVRLILPLLADTEAQPRIDAARALAQGASEAGEALLRLKALQGDPEDTVTAECLSGLSQGWPERSVDFLFALTEAHPPINRLALQALGESRSDTAWKKLIALYEADLSPTKRKEIITALSFTRRQDALNWLFALIEDASPTEAATTIEALAVRRNEPMIWTKVEQLATARDKPLITEALAKARRM